MSYLLTDRYNVHYNEIVVYVSSKCRCIVYIRFSKTYDLYRVRLNDFKYVKSWHTYRKDQSCTLCNSVLYNCYAQLKINLNDIFFCIGNSGFFSSKVVAWICCRSMLPLFIFVSDWSLVICTWCNYKIYEQVYIWFLFDPCYLFIALTI